MNFQFRKKTCSTMIQSKRSKLQQKSKFSLFLIVGTYWIYMRMKLMKQLQIHFMLRQFSCFLCFFINQFFNFHIQTESDFISEEANDVDGAVNLYRNIGNYLGTKENQYNNSVPIGAILTPINYVNKGQIKHIFI